MEAPDFWDNAEASQKKMKELKSMKDDMETYQNLITQKEDMETLIEMSYEENDPSMIPEIQEMLDSFQAEFDNIRVKTLLSGEYDSENAIIKLNAGAGGTEACDWCSMLYRMYTRWADRKGFSIEILDYLDGKNSLEEAVTILKRDTRHFAKRQLTWFRRERDVNWIQKEEFGYDEEKILQAMLAILKEKEITD